jgi:hypothetical protein
MHGLQSTMARPVLVAAIRPINAVSRTRILEALYHTFHLQSSMRRRENSEKVWLVGLGGQIELCGLDTVLYIHMIFYLLHVDGPTGLCVSFFPSIVFEEDQSSSLTRSSQLS